MRVKTAKRLPVDWIIYQKRKEKKNKEKADVKLVCHFQFENTYSQSVGIGYSESLSEQLSVHNFGILSTYLQIKINYLSRFQKSRMIIVNYKS